MNVFDVIENKREMKNLRDTLDNVMKKLYNIESNQQEILSFLKNIKNSNPEDNNLF